MAVTQCVFKIRDRKTGLFFSKTKGYNGFSWTTGGTVYTRKSHIKLALAGSHLRKLSEDTEVEVVSYLLEEFSVQPLWAFDGRK